MAANSRIFGETGFIKLNTSPTRTNNIVGITCERLSDSRSESDVVPAHRQKTELSHSYDKGLHCDQFGDGKKHKIMYAKMRETLLRVIFPVMALREAVVVVEDVDGHSQDKFVQVCHLQAAVSVTGIEFST